MIFFACRKRPHVSIRRLGWSRGRMPRRKVSFSKDPPANRPTPQKTCGYSQTSASFISAKANGGGYSNTRRSQRCYGSFLAHLHEHRGYNVIWTIVFHDAIIPGSTDGNSLWDYPGEHYLTRLRSYVVWISLEFLLGFSWMSLHFGSFGN